MATDLTRLTAPSAATAGQGASIHASGQAAETISAAGARLIGFFQAPRRRSLALIMLLAGVLDFWNLQDNGYANT